MRWWQIKKRNADLERELRSDLELEEEEQRENGLPPEEARYAAQRAFGNTTLIREQTHEAWGWTPVERLSQDARHAFRQLRRTPGFTLVALLIMACGIGASTAVFSILDSVLLRSYAFRDPGQIVIWREVVQEAAREYPSVPDNYRHFLYLRSHASTIQDAALLQNASFVVNYAWSNWIDRDSYLNSGNFQDSELETTLDDGDVRNYTGINVVYPLPGTSKNGIVGTLANGWLVDSAITASTGEPLDLPSADFTCSSLYPTGGQTRAHWFNNGESCWHPLGTWERRTTPYSVDFIRDPAIILWNPAIYKQFRLPYREMAVRFRVEAYNGANHPTFGAPSTNVSIAPKYSPGTSYTGLGTLPTTQNNSPRVILTSLKIMF